MPQSVTANTSFPGLYSSVTPDNMGGLHGVAGFDYTRFEQDEPYRKIVMRKVGWPDCWRTMTRARWEKEGTGEACVLHWCVDNAEDTRGATEAAPHAYGLGRMGAVGARLFVKALAGE